MIEAINNQNLDAVLPLIKEYQQFYKVQNIDDVKNKTFFLQFGMDTEKGCLFGYKNNNKFIAFATVYFTFSSTITSKVAVMNDLYVIKEFRGQGIARKLITHCEKFAKSKNAVRLQWVTAKENEIAQKVYSAIGAKQSSWEFFTYAT